MNKSLVYFKQIMYVSYFAGILWLRRNPMSLAFATLSPFSLLFILLIISNGQYIQFAVAGSLVVTMVSFGLGLGEDIAYYRIDYKIQDIFVASAISQVAYMTGMTLSELFFGLPVMFILFFLALHFGAHITDLPTIICTALLIWGTMSSLGFFLSTHMSHTRNVRQIIAFVTVIMTVMPPVFYSVDKLPVANLCYTYNTIFSNNTTCDGISYPKRLVNISCIQYPNRISDRIYSFSQYKATMERKLKAILFSPSCSSNPSIK
jgi:ABC-2 type transport system permease protein